MSFERTKKVKDKKVKEILADKDSKSFGAVGGSDLDELIADAQKLSDNIFILNDENASLMEVSDWIVMNPALQEVLGGIPGFPCGMISQVVGPKDSGKTTTATEALISAQVDGGIAILLDTEKKYSIKRAALMGLDVKNLIIIQAKTIEKAFEKFIVVVNIIKNKAEYVNKEGELLNSAEYTALTPAKKKGFKKHLKYAHRKVCCVWDSLGATPSEAELDDGVKDFSMTAAKVIKGQLRKLLAYISEMKVAFVIVNQVYANMNTFGKKTTPYGGSGPEYHSVLILEFAKIGRIRPDGVKSPEPFCGIKTKVECIKNHLGQPFGEAELYIDHKGFVIGRSPEYAPKELLKELEAKIEEEDGAHDEGEHKEELVSPRKKKDDAGKKARSKAS